MHKPTETHWISLKRVLRYLKGTISHGLFLPRCSNLSLRAFTDADWAGDVDDCSSTSAYVILLGDCLISWKFIKQRTVAKSSTEAEYCALYWLNWRGSNHYYQNFIILRHHVLTFYVITWELYTSIRIQYSTLE